MAKKKTTKRGSKQKPIRKKARPRSVSKKVKKKAKNTHDDGKFKKGNTAGKGKISPDAKHKSNLTAAFNAAITENDILEVAKAMLEEAKEGNVKAADCILNRCLGKPVQPLSGEGGGPLEIVIVDYRNIDDSK